ncbi:MAG: hypothetical protein AAFY00_10505 [Bacteroidota bacterium]
MKIEIEITGQKATVKSGDFQEEMKKTWLVKQFKMNDLIQYIKDKRGIT